MPAASFSNYLISLPLEFLHWWFIEATFNLLKILRYTLAFFYRQLAIGLIFKTFFKPWKNEYRDGLVRFALFMGMFLKTMFLVCDFLFFSVLIFVEALVLSLWLLFPFIVVWGVYATFFPK